MKVRINKEDLLQVLNKVGRAVTGKGTLPELSGVFIEADNNKLLLKTTDLDISVQTDVAAEVIEAGTTLVDYKLLSEVVRKLPKAEIILEKQDGILRVNCRKSNFEIVLMNADTFPQIQKLNEDIEISLVQHVLKDMIRRVTYAVAQDETRPILQGVLLELKDNNFSLVALDGYRMAVRTIELVSELSIESVIPGKYLNEIGKLLDDSMDEVKITFSNNHVSFKLVDTVINCRLLEGKYVNYRSLLPKDFKYEATIKVEEFADSIERASLVSKSNTSNLVKLDISDEKMIISSNSTVGKVKDEIAISGKGGELEIAFNSRYLLEAIKNSLVEEIQFLATAPISPILIKEDNGGCNLILPVRIVNK